ncbi:MAG: hypothetical protein KJ046_04115 [Anaerolineae bacterium]|nr:hypothetical protein [Anaerolineae bacterium]RIK22409.1 MAG: hypothetical protein DCC51_05120 [Anaerolineae bacterium]
MNRSTRLFHRSFVFNALFGLEAGSMFLIDIALAAALGLGAHSDILYAAWGLPHIIGRGAFQSLTNSLIGLFGEGADESSIFSQTLTVIGIVSFVAALFMSLTSRWWLPLSVPGASAEIRIEGTSLAAILAWLIAFLAVAETQRAIYYRLGQNYIPSIARITGAFASIALIALATSKQDLMLAALGLVVGAATEMVVCFAGLERMGQRFRFSWPQADELRRMVHVISLPLLGQGLVISAGIAERAIASYLGPGAVTAVAYAFRIFNVLERFIFRGFVISTIQAYASGIKGNWQRDTRLLVLIAIPIMVIFATLSVPLISIAFERGRFNAESTQMVALALQAYAPAIPIIALNRIPYAMAFAQTRSRELLIYAAIFSITLVSAEIAMVAAGLTLEAFGFAYTLGIALATLWIYPRVRIDEMRGMWSIKEVSRLLGAGLITLAGTAAIVYALQQALAGWALAQWVVVITGSISSVLLLVSAAQMLHLVDAGQLAYLFRGSRR